MKFLVANELQRRWLESPPRGWQVAKEADVLSVDERKVLGYRPLVDVVLTNKSSQRRVWVELEVSRADPVANHVKFASAHLIQPLNSGDAFVSLVSNHIAHGRANLSAHAIYLLRMGGIRAFQMPLLGVLTGAQISGINQGKIALSQLPTPRLEEVIELTMPLGQDGGEEIYYATNKLEVILNIRQWNIDAHDERYQSLWGLRRVKYLVYDKRTGLFAPSKFCAYTRMEAAGQASSTNMFSPSMTIPFYSRIPQAHGIFDGQKAWKRLTRIGYKRIKVAGLQSSVLRQLNEWINAHSMLVAVDARQCEILVES